MKCADISIRGPSLVAKWCKRRGRQSVIVWPDKAACNFAQPIMTLGQIPLGKNGNNWQCLMTYFKRCHYGANRNPQPKPHWGGSTTAFSPIVLRASWLSADFRPDWPTAGGLRGMVPVGPVASLTLSAPFAAFARVPLALGLAARPGLGHRQYGSLQTAARGRCPADCALEIIHTETTPRAHRRLRRARGGWLLWSAPS